MVIKNERKNSKWKFCFKLRWVSTIIEEKNGIVLRANVFPELMNSIAVFSGAKTLRFPYTLAWQLIFIFISLENTNGGKENSNENCLVYYLLWKENKRFLPDTIRRWLYRYPLEIEYWEISSIIIERTSRQWYRNSFHWLGWFSIRGKRLIMSKNFPLMEPSRYELEYFFCILLRRWSQY